MWNCVQYFHFSVERSKNVFFFWRFFFSPCGRGARVIFWGFFSPVIHFSSFPGVGHGCSFWTFLNFSFPFCECKLPSGHSSVSLYANVLVSIPLFSFSNADFFLGISRLRFPDVLHVLSSHFYFHFPDVGRICLKGNMLGIRQSVRACKRWSGFWQSTFTHIVFVAFSHMWECEGNNNIEWVLCYWITDYCSWKFTKNLS